jgi:hypothetical protein
MKRVIKSAEEKENARQKRQLHNDFHHDIPPTVINQSISIDNREWWNHQKKQFKKECESLFKKLIATYEKEIFKFADESAWLEIKYNQAKEYIEQIKKLFEAKSINGTLPYETKIPRSVQLLPAYENFLKWLERRKVSLVEGIKDSQLAKDTEYKYTVKSVIMAYYYMHRNGIYPIKELEGTWILKNIHEKLHQTYGFSVYSFKNDWKPITSNKNYRINQPDAIRKSIELLKTFTAPNIVKAIDLANAELTESELKS